MALAHIFYHSVGQGVGSRYHSLDDTLDLVQLLLSEYTELASGQGL